LKDKEVSDPFNAGICLILVCIGIVISMVWNILPLVVFEIKNRLDKIICFLELIAGNEGKENPDLTRYLPRYYLEISQVLVSTCPVIREPPDLSACENALRL
jgi:hypothetical protein